MRAIFIRLLATSLANLVLGCQPDTSSEIDTTATRDTAVASVLTPGQWRGVLAVQGQEIPFLFEVKTEAGKPVVYLVNKGLNGDQRLRCDKISVAGDSTTIRLHTLEATLVVRADGKDRLKGNWVKHDTKASFRIPLTAFLHSGNPQDYLFRSDSQLRIFVYALQRGLTYKVEFKDEAGRTHPAVRAFKQDTTRDGAISATFFTTSGYYSYLFGNFANIKGKRHIRLASFDGNRAFLFDCMHGKSLQGDFYSSESGHQTWTAVLDPNAKLPQRQKSASGN